MKTNYADIHKNLIEQSKKGNQKAQFQLYNNYSKAMFSICYRIMNCREEAEDMLQEAFIECFMKINSFRYESSFGAWLKRIVINKCLNELKRKKIEFVQNENLVNNKELIYNDTNFSNNEKDIEYSVNKIKEALNSISDGYRVIFSLYLIEGYDHNEISEILNISVSTSKTQYMRAKQKIKQILSNQLAMSKL